MRMADKSPIQKLQEAVAETVTGVMADPKGSAARAAGQVRGVVSLGLTVAGQVASQVADKLTVGPPAEAKEYAPRPPLRVAEPLEPDTGPDTGPDAGPSDDHAEPEVAATPTDVARVVAKKAPPPKKAAPSTPSDKLPPRREPADEAPAKKTAAKKAPAKKAPTKKAPAKKATAKETPAKKTPAKKAPAKKAAPADEPLLDPATTKTVAAEARIGAQASEPDKG
jgi:DNA-binding protein HU-beta